MNTEKIINEWFHRLPTGYANYPYSDEELTILHKVLEENDFQLDQAFLDAKPVKDLEETEDDLQDPEFDTVLPEILSTELGLKQTLVDGTMSIYNSLSTSEKDAFKKNFRAHDVNSFTKAGYKPYVKFFGVIGEEKGLGRGEIEVLLAITDSETGGTGKHDIVFKDGSQVEVKELTKNGSFDPAKYGNPNNHDLTWPIKDFYELVVGPFENMTDPEIKLKSMLDNSSHEKVDELINIFRTYFTYKKGRSSNSAAQMFNFREISKGPFENMYRGFIQLNKFFGSGFEADVQDTRLSLKGKDTDTFWVSDDDAEKIKQGSGAEDPITINVGDEIDDENKNIVVWFKRLERSEFVKNPSAMIELAKKIAHGFFEMLAGIIWYYEGNPEPHLGNPDEFAMQNVTRGLYRIALKAMQKEDNTFVQKQ